MDDYFSFALTVVSVYLAITVGAGAAIGSKIAGAPGAAAGAIAGPIVPFVAGECASILRRR